MNGIYNLKAKKAEWHHHYTTNTVTKIVLRIYKFLRTQL